VQLVRINSVDSAASQNLVLLRRILEPRDPGPCRPNQHLTFRENLLAY
jgi:hypothetical protein